MNENINKLGMITDEERRSLLNLVQFKMSTEWRAQAINASLEQDKEIKEKKQKSKETDARMPMEEDAQQPPKSKKMKMSSPASTSIAKRQKPKSKPNEQPARRK